LTAETDRSWTYWKGYFDSCFTEFALLRFDRSTGVTERWTGTEWIDTGATIAKAVSFGDLSYDEITPEKAAAIIGAP
jgi:hypothetical protein